MQGHPTVALAEHRQAGHERCCGSGPAGHPAESSPRATHGIRGRARRQAPVPPRLPRETTRSAMPRHLHRQLSVVPLGARSGPAGSAVARGLMVPRGTVAVHIGSPSGSAVASSGGRGLGRGVGQQHHPPPAGWWTPIGSRRELRFGRAVAHRSSYRPDHECPPRRAERSGPAR